MWSFRKKSFFTFHEIHYVKVRRDDLLLIAKKHANLIFKRDFDSLLIELLGKSISQHIQHTFGGMMGVERRKAKEKRRMIWVELSGM